MALRIKKDHKYNASEHKSQYFYHEALDDDYTFTFTQTKNELEISLDNCKSWITLENNTKTPKIKKGERIYIKCNSPKIDTDDGIGNFSSNGKFKIGGNIMSLVHGDDFKNNNTMSDGQFQSLFQGNGWLISSKMLYLPLELKTKCFAYMFYNCKKMEDAPKLKATTLKEHCYIAMFHGCKKLKEITMLGENIDEPYAVYMFCMYCSIDGTLYLSKNVPNDLKQSRLKYSIMSPRWNIVEI